MLSRQVALLLILAVAVFAAEKDPKSEPPQNPIIGVYTVDAEDFGQDKTPFQTYIASSYVKYIQMSAAQVVPLFYHYSQEQLDTILPKLNGVLFPGGVYHFQRGDKWTQNIDYILKWANK